MNVCAVCATAGINEQKLPGCGLCLQQCRDTQESRAGQTVEDNLIFLQEQDLMRTLSVIIIKAEGQIFASKSEFQFLKECHIPKGARVAKCVRFRTWRSFFPHPYLETWSCQQKIQCRENL